MYHNNGSKTELLEERKQLSAKWSIISRSQKIPSAEICPSEPTPVQDPWWSPPLNKELRPFLPAVRKANKEKTAMAQSGPCN